MKNQKGITLIALVITIIVLLILAGVSIAMLTGNNGILTQANNSKLETAKAEAVDKINLALNAMKSEIYNKQISNSTYTPASSDTTADAAITKILSDDFQNISTSEIDGYWYKVAGKKITIYYKNDAQNIKEAISGSLDLGAAPYTITEAK